MKIICIGHNYVDHIKELNSPFPTEPVFFLKPETAIIKNNKAFYYPDFSNEIHYETELVLKISKPGKNIDQNFADKYYEEISVGIDFTARDIQNEFKKKGLPWEKAKAFDGSAPIGTFINKKGFPDLNNVGFHLFINGKQVQEGNSGNLLFSFNIIIAHVSKFITLKKGDLIYTGTPKGIGPIQIGDKLEAFIENKKLLEFNIK